MSLEELLSAWRTAERDGARGTRSGSLWLVQSGGKACRSWGQSRSAERRSSRPGMSDDSRPRRGALAPSLDLRDLHSVTSEAWRLICSSNACGFPLGNLGDSTAV